MNECRIHIYFSIGLLTAASSSSSSLITSNRFSLGVASVVSKEDCLSTPALAEIWRLIDDATKYPSLSVSEKSHIMLIQYQHNLQCFIWVILTKNNTDKMGLRYYLYQYSLLFYFLGLVIYPLSSNDVDW